MRTKNENEYVKDSNGTTHLHSCFTFKQCFCSKSSRAKNSIESIYELKSKKKHITDIINTTHNPD